MLNLVSVLRYGDWSGQPEVAPILAEFLNNLGGTSWMNINNGYYDRSGNTGTSAVSHGGTCFDPYSHGKKLSDADVLVSSDPPCSVSLYQTKHPRAVFPLSSAPVARQCSCKVQRWLAYGDETPVENCNTCDVRGCSQAVVKTCLASGLPRDPDGAYFVISSADVAQGGFCTSYCGWHDDKEGL